MLYSVAVGYSVLDGMGVFVGNGVFVGLTKTLAALPPDNMIRIRPIINATINHKRFFCIKAPELV